MSFSHPQAFLLSLILVPFILIALYNFRRKKQLLNLFISSTAYGRLGIRSGQEIAFFKTVLMLLAFIFFIVALAGPQWGERYENIDVQGVEMLFILDTSNSMLAEDLQRNRLEVAKQLINQVVDALKTDYVGLINFAGSAYIQCPLTIDYGVFKLLVEATDISPREDQGTDFASAFELALRSYKDSKTNQKLVIFITDGEDQEGKWQDFLNQLKEAKVVVFAIGVGQRGGAPIPVRDKDNRVVGWKKDKDNKRIKTRLDEQTLIHIASETGGQYFYLGNITSIDRLLENLKNFEKEVISSKVKLQKIRRFHYPLFIGIIFLLIELFLSERKLKWKNG